jgi:trehalose 6-phosphate synthase
MTSGAGRLVVVSNRVPALRDRDGVRHAGGLVAAVLPALERRGGLWLGWSGNEGGSGTFQRSDPGRIEYATLDLTATEVRDYYLGFSNSTLWPLLHGLPQHSDVRPAQYAAWRAVHARFARAAAPLLAPGDAVWVHDYQLMPLGMDLRRLGWDGPLAYFHHVPVPPPAAWAAIPRAGEIAAALPAYDLIGVQTERDARRLRAIVGMPAGRRVIAAPIGIDAEHVRSLAREHPADPFEQLRRGRRVLFGLDRLDYTKGIPLRLLAFERLLGETPALADHLVLVQWSAPSRESIPAYAREREEIRRIAARINARYLQPPVVVEVATRSEHVAAAALRDAEVCLVTSLADGMNLVAKEYVAAQRPEAPGVLVLSDGCGAAEELGDAVIAPAGDVAATAGAIRAALELPSPARRERWRRLEAAVFSDDVHAWGERFLERLRMQVAA